MTIESANEGINACEKAFVDDSFVFESLYLMLALRTLLGRPPSNSM